MKMAILCGVSGFIFLIIIINSILALGEVRSDVYNLSQKEITLSAATFSGFDYDIDDNTSTENLTLRLSNIDADRASATLSDQKDANGNLGVTYTTEAQPTDFDFAPWGQYEKIKFFGLDYFAAYDDIITSSMEDAYQSVPFLFDRSTNSNLMTDEQISEILVDDSSERAINTSKPLELEEGYKLAINTSDLIGKKVHIDLTKNGQVVDSKIIQPSVENANMADKTYYYRTDLGKTKGVVIIAVHFENILRGNSTDYAEVDGIFQISDSPTTLQADQVNPTSLTIKMDNKNNEISVRKNKNIQLMKDLYIKTADQNVINSQNPLRYYVYITKPRWYMLHGSVANLGVKEFNWTSTNFPGFYYDVDKDIGTERITFRLSDINSDNATLSDQVDDESNRGIVYITKAQPKNFKFEPWGQYDVMGFLGECYFAAYNDTVTQNVQREGETVAYLYNRSTNRNLLANEQISKTLVDTDVEQTVTSKDPLKLEEGYQLALKSIDSNGNKAYLELSKDGTVVGSQVIQSSSTNAEIGDKTYYYKTDLGDTKDIVQIAVHFKNVFSGSDINIATVDGIFQISGVPTSIKAGLHYDTMSISEVNPSAMTIKMDNRDNKITIRKNKNILLMGDIYISVADQGDISAVNPLRYYIYKDVDVKDDALASKEQSTKKSEIKELNYSVTDKSRVDNETVTTNPVESKEPGNIPAKVDESKKNATKYGAQNVESKKQPDFESALAITSILAVAYLTIVRKQ
jgi:S-layer protein (TIGR01567 family)